MVMSGTGQPLPVGMKVICAGTAGCVADIFTFPLDTAKVRLQVQGENSKAQKSTFSFSKAREARANFRYKGVFGTIATVAREEGPQGLYRGIIPGLQRQMCFCAVRIGLYDSIKDVYTDVFGFQGANLFTRISAGITSGGMAVLFAQPTDVVKVRMQAQSTADPTKARRYTGALQAYRKIFIEEGIRGLWKGTTPNITRNAVVNASELVSYDLVKDFILRKKLMEDNVPCHFASAFCAGFITTCVASPVDVVKTRYMNSHPGQYSGALDCAYKMFREGGPMAFYKGFMPNFVRLGAWNIVMFVTFEQLKRIAYEHKSGKRKQEVAY